MFYNILTTSTNKTHIKRKNSILTIFSSETISSRIFGSAPNYYYYYLYSYIILYIYKKYASADKYAGAVYTKKMCLKCSVTMQHTL
jgi:hypothetical protein